MLYRSKPQSLRVKTVTLIEPYARVIIFPDRNTNIKEVLTPADTKPPPEKRDAEVGAGATEVAATAAPSPPPRAAQKTKSKGTVAANKNAPRAPPAAPLTPFPVSIGTVRFVNATLNYTDLWIKPSFSVGIQTLNGDVTGSVERSEVSRQGGTDGKVERYSPAHIGGRAKRAVGRALYRYHDGLEGH